MKKENPGSKPIKKSTKIDWSLYLFLPGVYHWRYFSEEDQLFYEYSIDETNSLEELLPDDKCIGVHLFNYPDSGSMDVQWKHNNWQQDLIGEYFHEAFEDWAFHETANLKELFTDIIIPKRKYNEILNKIEEFGLLHIKDLLLETVAISQYIITHELPHWDTQEYRRMRMTAQAETEKAIRVVELSGVPYKYSKYYHLKLKEFSPGLSSITFKFNDKTSIKIQHKGLAEEFVDHLMRYYDELKNKDWRKDLASYPERFGQSHLKDSFQKQIILAYFKLFTENKWLVSDKKHPSRMMRCIVCMLEFSLLPISEEDYSDFRKGKIVSALLVKMGY